MKFRSLLLATLCGVQVLAQTPRNLNSSEILHSLQKLNTVGAVLYVAAHPDDENTRLLSYLSNEMRLRTGYLSITRGDGGQNLIGKEQGELLGLIRTQELLAARRIDGAEQFFTRANDFGYSKNPEETMAIWNKDSILSDVVWAIRKFRPDVIICRFPTTGEGGHGHHTASAMLALEAFDAAADPTRFPEQLKYAPVWKTKRIFWNTFNFGSTNTTSPDQLKLDVGVYNNLLGKGYGEIASESRSMHKSQGFGAARTRGETIEYFKLLKGDSVKENIFERIDFTWKRIPGSENLIVDLEKCIANFSQLQPQYSIPALLKIRKQLLSISGKDPFADHWKTEKLKALDQLIQSCLSLWTEAAATHYVAIPGKTIEYSVQVLARNNYPVKLKSIRWINRSDSTTTLELKHNKLYTFRHKEVLSSASPWSSPFWLKQNHPYGHFNIQDQLLRNVPETAPGPQVELTVEIDGTELILQKPLVYKFTDPVKGEVYRPLEILPPATVTSQDPFLVFTASGETKKVRFLIKSNQDSLQGFLELAAPEGWEIRLEDPKFKLTRRNDEVIMEASITNKASGKGKLMAAIRIGDDPYRQSIHRIEYDHIPYQFLLKDSEVDLIPIQLKTAGKNIGYIPGAGDDVASCLQQAGYQVTILTDEMIEKGSLRSYSAIITGVRAFNTNERLILLQNKLLEYVKEGGNLIVQYNTNSRVGPLKTTLGPYPFSISRQRVTDERSEVTILLPDHPVLTTPNKITLADFEGWVQERGIYFTDEWNAHYATVLTMNDKGEKPMEGSLIISPYGKGNFVYTGLSFFRQLPAGVPGAFRLFSNLLALPSHK